MARSDLDRFTGAGLAGCDSLIFDLAGEAAAAIAPRPAQPGGEAWFLPGEPCDRFDLILAGPGGDGPDDAGPDGGS